MLAALPAAVLPWAVSYHDPTSYQPAVSSSVSTIRLGLDTDYPVCP